MSDASYISRRAFLKALGLGTASVTAAAALTACGGSAASSTTAAPASGSAAASAASLEPGSLCPVGSIPHTPAACRVLKVGQAQQQAQVLRAQGAVIQHAAPLLRKRRIGIVRTGLVHHTRHKTKGKG